MAAWAKEGDGSVVLLGEAVYPVVPSETFHSKNPCVSRTRRWEAVVGTNVANYRVGSGGGGTSVYHVCVETM